MKSKLFYYFIIGHIFVSMISYYPNLLAKDVYKGFIFAIIIGYFISMLNGYFLISTYNIFERKDLVFITRQLFNKFVGYTIVIIHMITALVTGICIYISLIIVVGSNVMPTTSRVYISIFVIFIFVVAFKNTEKNILYSIGFFALFSAVLVPLIFIMISTEIDIRFIIGAITHSLNRPLLIMIISSSYFFNGIENLAVYNVALGKKSFKIAALIYGFIAIPLSLFPVLVPIGVWGPNAIKVLTFPILATSDTVALDFFIIERTLYLMLPLYISLQILGCVIYFYNSYTLLKKTITSNKARWLILIVVTSAIILLAKVASDFEEVLEFARLWGYIWFFSICIISPLLYFMSKKWLRKQR